jgi:hypothetical protein
VDFGGSPGPAAPNGLVLGPPFPPAAQRWVLAVVLSMHIMSVASKTTRFARIPDLIAAFDQRLNRL